MNKKQSIKIRNTILKTPFIIGSCDMVSTFEEASTIAKIGGDSIGAIVWKSTTLEPRKGYKEPITCDYKQGFLVASGMKNIGITKTIEEVTRFKDKYPDQVLIVSIASVNINSVIDEFKTLTKMLCDTKIDGIELNLSCPHQVEGDKFKTHLIAQDEGLVGKIVKEVSHIIKATNKCLSVKLTGWNADIASIARRAEANGADAIVISNIFPGVGYYTGLEEHHNDHHYEIGESLLGNFKGGYTGVSLLPAILLMINETRRNVKIPIFATGGCMSSDDAVIQSLFAGASAIVSSTFYYDINGRGPRNFKHDLDEKVRMLNSYMQKYEIKTINDFYRED